MADRWETELQDASYGGLPLDVVSISMSSGQVLATHEYPNVDGANVKPMGRKQRIISATLVFFAQDADDDYLSRFIEFYDKAHNGLPDTFVHPVYGSFLTYVGQFDDSEDPNQRDTILVNCSFEEASTEIANLSGGDPGAAEAAAVNNVSIAVDQANDSLDAAGLESDVPSLSFTTVNNWVNKNSRDIRLEMADLSNKIDTEVQAFQVATDIENYGVYRDMLKLHFAISNAAKVFSQGSNNVIEFTVTKAAPVRVIAAQMFGADRAEKKANEIRKLNDIRTPHRVEAGTVLKAQGG